MAKFLSDIGHKVTVVCASDDTRLSSDETIGNLRIIRLSGGDFCIPEIEGKSVWKKLRCLVRFHSYRKKIRRTIMKLPSIDIIEVPEYGAEALYLVEMNIPITIRLHTPSILNRNNLKPEKYTIFRLHEWYCANKEIIILKREKYISSCSLALKKWVVQYLNIKRDDIKVIYNPINTQCWSILSNGKRIKNTILFIGTVAEVKGVSELLDAVKLLRKRKNNVGIKLVGKLGSYGTSKKDEFLSEKWCHFTGGVDRDRVRELLLSHSIVCLPSWWENMPMSCIEAMMCGCVVIGSSCGGMSEIIEPSISGFLVPPKNKDALSNMILNVLDMDEQHREEIGKMARARIEKVFSMDKIVPELISYYNCVIQDFYESEKNIMG